MTLAWNARLFKDPFQNTHYWLHKQTRNGLDLHKALYAAFPEYRKNKKAVTYFRKKTWLTCHVTRYKCDKILRYYWKYGFLDLNLARLWCLHNFHELPCSLWLPFTMLLLESYKSTCSKMIYRISAVKKEKKLRWSSICCNWIISKNCPIVWLLPCFFLIITEASVHRIE